MKAFITYSISILAIIILSAFSTQAQIQKGNDIDGENTYDYSGCSVSMPNANTVAIGSNSNTNVGGNYAGQVRIYNWNGAAWAQKGQDIHGNGYKRSGNQVSMSDVNTVAISCLTGSHVRVYRWNGTAWVQKGIDIDAEVYHVNSGISISMPDSNTLATGDPENNGNGWSSGHVRIYSWNGTAWVQKGIDIDGEAAGDKSGWSVSMPDSNTVAIGAYLNFGSAPSSGHVRIYRWNGAAWVQKGNDINGEASYDEFGYSVSMPDSNTVAIGAPKNDGNGSCAGHVRIYSWGGTDWVQKGNDIDGETFDDLSGWSVSMPDPNTVAIGTPDNNGNGIESGHVRIYAWNGTVWTKYGLDIDGEGAGDCSGYSVSMPDSNTVAIGAPGDGSPTPGYVRIYTELCKTFATINTYCCDSLISPSGNYIWTSNGCYHDTIPNAAGCDSVITVNLTVYNVDATVTNTSPTLVANTTSAIYQWLDCNNAMAIMNGETNQSYTATANGSYAVEVTQNGCVDTSACQLVNNIGIQKNDFDDALSLYPNPTKGKITIKCEKMERVEVLDITGKVLYEQLVSSDAADIDISAFSKGVYFVKVFSAEGVGVERVVLE